MVEFFNAHDAKEAFHSHEAILNNRFIRIYWGSYGFKRLLEYHTKRCNMVRKGNENAQKPHKRFVVPPQPQSQVSQTFSTFDSPIGPNNSMFNSNNYSSNLKRHLAPKATNALPKPAMPTFLNVPHVEYKKLIAEVKEESTRLSEALANQKKLLVKHQSATSPSAKTAIKELLKLEMFNIKELKSSIESKHSKLKTAQEFKVNHSVEEPQTPNPKVPSIPCSPSSVTSNHSLEGNAKAPALPCPTSSTTATHSGIANETSISSVNNPSISDQESDEEEDDDEKVIVCFTRRLVCYLTLRLSFCRITVESSVIATSLIPSLTKISLLSMAYSEGGQFTVIKLQYSMDSLNSSNNLQGKNIQFTIHTLSLVVNVHV